MLTGNAIVDNRVEQRNNGPLARFMPSGNTILENDAEVGFVSLKDGDYRIGPQSKLKRKSGNNSDPGVDMDGLVKAIGPEK